MPEDRTGVRVPPRRPELPAPDGSALGTSRDRSAESVRERIEALSRILGTPADLLITDIAMPASFAGGTEIHVLAERARAAGSRLSRVSAAERGSVPGLAAPGQSSLSLPEGMRTPVIVSATALEPELQGAENHLALAPRIVASLLTALEAKDPNLPDHGARVAVLARRVGLELGLSPEELALLELASLVHDLGKIGVPEAILQKPGPLTPDEFLYIRRHPGCSARILRPLEEFRGCIQYVYHHHERFDGTGYPDGLSGTRIPMGARILSVCDAADAMSSDRPYRAALDERQIREDLLQGRGTQFDGDVVDAILSLFYR